MVNLQENVELWWPNGYGDQHLYKLSFKFVSSLGTNHTKSIKIGFRTIKLVQDYVDKNTHEKGTYSFVIVK